MSKVTLDASLNPMSILGMYDKVSPEYLVEFLEYQNKKISALESTVNAMAEFIKLQDLVNKSQSKINVIVGETLSNTMLLHNT